MKCQICKQRKATEARAYCRPCWDSVMTPAFKHVESVPPDYPAPLVAWHGWALREAFIAGAAHQMKLQKDLTPVSSSGKKVSRSGTTKDSLSSDGKGNAV